MVVDLDVIVDVHADVEPVRVDKPVRRQRLQGRALVLLEEGAPRQPAVAPHGARVERGQEFRDARVQRGE